MALMVVCILTAGTAVLWLTPRFASKLKPLRLHATATSDNPVFLFDDDILVDWSSAARPFVRQHKGKSNWSRLREVLKESFPDLPETPYRIRDHERLVLTSNSGDPWREAHLEWLDGGVRVQLFPKDSQSTAATSDELVNLRAAMNGAPYPVWRLTPQGDVTWTNHAYDALQKKICGNKPEAPLFPDTPKPTIGAAKSRVAVVVPNCAQKLWYDVSVVETERGKLCYANDVNAIVDAEIAQRNFVQTLAKTFAQLSIGLAIFDRNRQLALFNPALIDLTALQVDFLSSRPTLFSFFDRLRDRRMMPEPKNYNDWRQQISDLVEAASDGHYRETWTLPSGSVYSISGRPHPDGAVAFLFEDITADVTLTRQFRAELELNQSIRDNIDQAIAVFSAVGSLASSNVSYRGLWDCDPEQSFAQVTIQDATLLWQKKMHGKSDLGRYSRVRIQQGQPGKLGHRSQVKDRRRHELLGTSNSKRGDHGLLLSNPRTNGRPENRQTARQIRLIPLAANLVLRHCGGMIANGQQITLDSPDKTGDLARHIGAGLTPGDCVLLEGSIGTGKSHFSRQLIQSLLEAPEDIPSPTFTLIQTYNAPVGEIWHTDLYRLSSLDDVEELGLFEAFEDAICLVEWPDRLQNLAPDHALHIKFALDPECPDTRCLTLSWSDQKWTPRMEKIPHA